MSRSLLFLPIFSLLLTAGCDAEDPALCGDAASWSQRGASWPTDGIWLGEARLDQAEAVDLLELPAADGLDRLARELVVAELNLAAGEASPDVLDAVYAGHAWYADHEGEQGAVVQEEAHALADVLAGARTCS